MVATRRTNYEVEIEPNQNQVTESHNSELSPKANTSGDESECECSIEDDESVAVPLLLSTPTSQTKPKMTYPARTNNAGVPVTLQKELAQDIEQFGGLEKFKSVKCSTSKLCRAKTDLCGVGGSPL